MIGKLGLRREKGIVGLDIGSYAIKAIELDSKKKDGGEQLEAVKAGYELLPHDAIVEGTIIDAEAVSETIKMIFTENKISNSNVAISISGTSVIIKKISLPAMESEELAESIIWEAKHNIPYPYEETNVDYTILKPPEGSEAQNLDILLVAAKKEKVTNYSNVLDQAHKHLRAIEVDVFALQNAMEINYPELLKEKTVAIINLGANITNLMIIENGIPQLFRDLSIGGLLFIENMRKELGISFDDAEKTLKGIPVKNIPPEQLQSALTTNVENLLQEIEKTYSFYKAGATEEKKIDHILLSGGLSNLKDLMLFFEQKFKIKTEIFNPFRNIFFNEKKLDPMYIQDMAPSFGVATGLATRTVER